MHLLPLLLCALLMPLLAQAEPQAPDAERQAELETLLYQDCGSCHGMTLRGGLGPALPRDRMNEYSVEALSHLILSGIPGTAMPGWGALIDEADARWIAEHLQTDNPLDTVDSQE